MHLGHIRQASLKTPKKSEKPQKAAQSAKEQNSNSTTHKNAVVIQTTTHAVHVVDSAHTTMHRMSQGQKGKNNTTFKHQQASDRTTYAPRVDHQEPPRAVTPPAKPPVQEKTVERRKRRELRQSVRVKNQTAQNRNNSQNWCKRQRQQKHRVRNLYKINKK